MRIYKNEVYASKKATVDSPEKRNRYIIEQELRNKDKEKQEKETAENKEWSSKFSDCSKNNTYCRPSDIIDCGRPKDGMKRFESSCEKSTIPLPPPGYCGERCKSEDNSVYEKSAHKACSYPLPTPCKMPGKDICAFGYFTYDDNNIGFTAGSIPFNNSFSDNLGVYYDPKNYNIVVDKPGIYLFYYSVRVSSQPNNSSMAVYVNDVIYPLSKLELKEGSNSNMILLKLGKGDKIRVIVDIIPGLLKYNGAAAALFLL